MTPLLRPVVPDEYGKNDDIVVGDRHLLGERWAGQQVEHRRHTFDRIDRHDFGDVGAFDRLAGDVEEHRDRDQDGRARILELMTDLAGGVGRVDRGDGAAGVGNTVEEAGVLGDVRRHQASVEPGPKPDAARPPASIWMPSAQLGERHRAADRAVDDRRFVRELIGVSQRVVGDRNVHWGISTSGRWDV